MPKVAVIYIASIGRSGSTLLELLLNGFENLWTMGELFVLPWYIGENRGRCGCGHTVVECDFWQPIVNRMRPLLGVEGNIALFRDTYSNGKFFRPGDLLRILFKTRAVFESKTDSYCSDNFKLLAEIREQAQIRRQKKIEYLVDASKDFYRLHRLSRCRDIDLKVIHIVKDPRAYVYSKIKNDRMSLTARAAKSIRMSLKYTIENYLIEKVLKTVGVENTFFVRYEDLASDPQKTLRSIGRWLNLSGSRHAIHSFRRVPNHGIAGNSMRHQTEEIFLDEHWKNDLHRWISKLVTLLTIIPGRAYHYFRT